MKCHQRTRAKTLVACPCGSISVPLGVSSHLFQDIAAISRVMLVGLIHISKTQGCLTKQAHPQPGTATVERNQKEQMKSKHPLVASAPAVVVQRFVRPHGLTNRCSNAFSLIGNQLMLWVSRANPNIRAFRFGMKDGLLLVLVACGTKPMRWLTRLVAWFEVVCKKPGHYRLKRIAGAFALPFLGGYELLSASSLARNAS